MQPALRQAARPRVEHRAVVGAHLVRAPGLVYDVRHAVGARGTWISQG